MNVNILKENKQVNNCKNRQLESCRSKLLKGQLQLHQKRDSITGVITVEKGKMISDMNDWYTEAKGRRKLPTMKEVLMGLPAVCRYY